MKPLLLATVATLGLAAALPASASPISITVLPAPSPFTLENLGSPVGESFSFVDGSSPSGIYVGSTGVAASPFGPLDSTSKYLVAEGGGGTVTVKFAHPQNSFDLLWGTVDASFGRNLLTFKSGNQTVATIGGQDIASYIGGFTDGADNVYVEITGLPLFTQVVASDNSDPAFEFVPGVDAPEPAGLALFGVGLLGLGMVTKRRRYV